MGSQGSQAIGLEYLRGLDGNIEVQNDAGYWVKMEASRATVTAERPHGIRYSLSLHAPDNTRLIGFDNAQQVRASSMQVKNTPMTIGIDTPGTKVCCTSLTTLTSWSVIFMLKLIAY
ncbi:MAG: hypothetical protein ACYC4S_16725 [Rhodoferax sp.]